MSDTAINEQQSAPDFTLPAAGSDDGGIRDFNARLDIFPGAFWAHRRFPQKTVQFVPVDKRSGNVYDLRLNLAQPDSMVDRSVIGYLRGHELINGKPLVWILC